MNTATLLQEEEIPVQSQTSRHHVTIPLPGFDQHTLEESLLINHRQFNGVPLTREQVAEAILSYREFWRAHKLAGTPDTFEVPSLLIDRVWHTHICETKQYARDCEVYFGTFFHHESSLCDGGAEPGDW